jgi:hypothetical protein
MPKRKSPEDFFKKTRENGSEDSKDIKRKDKYVIVGTAALQLRWSRDVVM